MGSRGVRGSTWKLTPDKNGNGTLTSSAFDGYKHGVIALRVHGILTGSANGKISVEGKGFLGAVGGGATATGYSPGGSAPYNNGNGVGEASGGGGGYSTAGGAGDASPSAGAGSSVVYGTAPLAQLFLGSGGGAGNIDWYAGGCGPGDATPCSLPSDQPNGGSGGGIIYIAGQSINFPGSIGAAGSPRTSVPDSALHGGGGAGGSIRIEGNTIQLGKVSASGGSYTDPYGYGGQGRIAVYYQSSYAAVVAIPAVYTGILGQPPTATPSPTPISFATPSSYGTGKDGSLTVTTTFNLNTDRSNTRVCADAVAYNVVELLASSARLSSTPESGCLAAGDEILLIHLSGSGPNIGSHEYLRIGGVIGDTIYFKTPKANYYGANAGDDTTIGVGTGQQRVMLMRVPNYENVMINGTLTSNGTLISNGILTSNAFDGYKYGVIAFRVHGTLGGNAGGVITASSRGFAGAIGGVTSAGGYSPGGSAPYNNGTGVEEAHGGGGGHATVGGLGGYTLHAGGGGSVIYGNAPLTQLFFGSGGGASNIHWINSTCGSDDHACKEPLGQTNGGPGGGIIFIAGQTINFAGSIVSTGSDRPTLADSPLRGGAGAGGSIRIEGYTITLASLSAAGGAATDGGYGYGGSGRIAIYYSNTFTNSAVICAQASIYCKNTSQVPTPTATATAPTPTSTRTPTPMPQGWYANHYTYSTNIPHAVASVNRNGILDQFTYDANGNMTCRKENGVSYKQDYNPENRIAAIHKMSGSCSTGTAQESWLFVYDGDGVRVSTAHYTAGISEPDLITRYYFGGAYETSSNGTWRKYYAFAGQTIAMKDSAGLQYFLTDHLGSILSTLGSNGTLISQQRYLPFGAVRTDVGSITQTDFGYTGQRKLDSGMGGIMDYKARFFSPCIMQFIQPDTLVPQPANPQAWNRYSYVQNNPIKLNDPTGHKCVGDDSGCIPGEGGTGPTKPIKILTPYQGRPHGEDDPNPHCFRCRLPGDEMIGPTPTSPVPPGTDDSTSGFTLLFESYEWLDMVEEAALFMDNYGVPAYRHAKGVVPGGPVLEGGLGFATTFLGDLNNPNLTWQQRALRPFVVGAEDALIDMGATAGAAAVGSGGGIVTFGTGPGAAFTAGALFFGTSIALSELGDGIAKGLNERFLPDYFPKE